MDMRTSIFALLALIGVATLLTAGSSANDNSFAVRDAHVFDGERMIPSANVIVRDGRITVVKADAAIPADLPVIEGRGRTLLPGLIDSHVHVFPGAQADALRFGVTTELDMFNLTHEFLRWRKQRESLDRTQEADTWSAGTGVSAPGGHPSGTMPGSEHIPTLANAADAAAFVNARLAEGSDYVKVMMEDNWVYTPDHTIPTLSREEVCAAIAAAHAAGRVTIVHVSRQQDARTAIECRTDGLAHLFADSVVDADFVTLARNRNVFIETTLAVVAGGSGWSFARELYASPDVMPFLSVAQRQMIEGDLWFVRNHGIGNALRSARILHAAGVPLLAATDAPNPAAPHGVGLHAELRMLVDAGFAPREALNAATALPARIFHLAGRGRIASGYRADLLLVRGDPTRDIAATLAIDNIWKNGFAVDRAAATR